MMAEPVISRGERILIGLAGLLLASMMLSAPRLLRWWMIWATAQFDAIAGLLGWR